MSLPHLQSLLTQLDSARSYRDFAWLLTKPTIRVHSQSSGGDLAIPRRPSGGAGGNVSWQTHRTSKPRARVRADQLWRDKPGSHIDLAAGQWTQAGLARNSANVFFSIDSLVIPVFPWRSVGSS